MPSIFTRIINREFPARVFYETDQVIVIADHHYHFMSNRRSDKLVYLDESIGMTDGAIVRPTGVTKPARVR